MSIHDGLDVLDSLNLLTDFALEQAEFANDGDLERVNAADALLRAFIFRALSGGEQ